MYDAGVLPTPAAAYLIADLDADFGVMISASHNPAPDNGIKFFARGDQKLPDEVEDAIEAQLGKEPSRPVGGDVGRIQRFSDARTATSSTCSAPCRTVLRASRLSWTAPTVQPAAVPRRSSPVPAPKL
ncbi:phosphoglucosamine mutase [Arthrobacter sp. Hiyo1]|nr:phosphoglucosamine mutase [Arthrobacter sp. Hiyo1]